MQPDWPFPADFVIPSGDADRLMVADALESTDPTLAEFIRLQIEIENTPRRLVTKTQIKLQGDLVNDHGHRWAGPMARQVLDFHFQKGFIQRVICRVGPLLSHGHSWMVRHPIRDLTLLPEPANTGPVTQIENPLLKGKLVLPPEFFDHPLLKQVECLDLSGLPLDDSNWKVFFAKTRPHNLKRLAVKQVTKDLVEHLIGHPYWENLVHFQASIEPDSQTLKILCRAVASNPTKGPRIFLTAITQPGVQEMIQTSRWAKRFAFRD